MAALLDERKKLYFLKTLENCSSSDERSNGEKKAKYRNEFGPSTLLSSYILPLASKYVVGPSFPSVFTSIF